ncbi:MAG: hypothetical protein P0S95_00280 [Rhabdochlamydiaceae bacterium]|nr:hypothetical protein [Candidatus Amphrikana amoebophyrae]
MRPVALKACSVADTMGKCVTRTALHKVPTLVTAYMKAQILFQERGAAFVSYAIGFSEHGWQSTLPHVNVMVATAVHTSKTDLYASIYKLVEANKVAPEVWAFSMKEKSCITVYPTLEISWEKNGQQASVKTVTPIIFNLEEGESL